MKEQIIKLDQLDFTDRESYIAWRAEWREAYKALSQKIRETRSAFKSMQRKVYMAKFPGQWGEEPVIDDKPLWSCQDYGRLLTSVRNHSMFAVKMMEIRTRSKVKAGHLRNGEAYTDCTTVKMPLYFLELEESRSANGPEKITFTTVRSDSIAKEKTWRDRISTFLFGKI